jgi:hypothetical protein
VKLNIALYDKSKSLEHSHYAKNIKRQYIYYSLEDSDVELVFEHNTVDFYFWVLHPVACIIKVNIRSAVPRNNFSKMFIFINLLPLHVSALVGHPQAEYTIAGSCTRTHARTHRPIIIKY